MQQPMRGLIVAGLLCACAASARAGGSAYSLFGIGELSLSPTARSLSMGGLSSALWSTTSLLPENPASWSAIKTTRLQGTFGYENISTQSSSSSGSFSTSGIRGAAVALPVDASLGMTLGIGFAPVSNVMYALDYGVEQVDTQQYVAKYTGTGGLSKFFLGSSIAPLSWLSVGASLEYNFGSITRGVNAQFMGAAGIPQTSIADRYSPDGFDARISAMAAVSGITVGASVRLPSILHTQLKEMYAATSYGAKDTAIDRSYNQDFPLSIGAGVSYSAGRVMVGAEFSTEDWSSVLVDGTHPRELQQSSTVGIGAERVGDLSATGFDRWSLRIGLTQRASYIAVNGSPINETWGSLGAAIPINLATTFEFALQYGSRGSTDNGLVRERVFRLNTSISINELWFQHPE